MKKLFRPGVALIVCLLVAGPGRVADDKAGGYDHCAKACHECARTCDCCAAHCAHLLTDGKKEHLRTLRSCQDCATFCSAAACITARKGPYSEQICKGCAEVCKCCAEECEKIPQDSMMKKCAEECRRCEKACQEMLSHVRASK